MRSEIRELTQADTIAPDCASLHPGYGSVGQMSSRSRRLARRSVLTSADAIAREMVGTALRAFAHPTTPLLRCDLPWRGRRGGEIGGELGVARLGVFHRLFLHGAVAADAVGQREQFDRGVVRDGRQQAEHGGDVLLVTCDQIALELAVGA